MSGSRQARTSLEWAAGTLRDTGPWYHGHAGREGRRPLIDWRQMNLGDALAWLDRHQNLERILADRRLQAPNPERMRRLAHLMGDPQSAQPVVHLTGTNGKTSTARALSQLFISMG